jgi:hypothetical protein
MPSAQTFDFRDNRMPPPPPLQRTDSAGYSSVDRTRQESRRFLRPVPEAASPRDRVEHAFPINPASMGDPSPRLGRRPTDAPTERPERQHGKAHVGSMDSASVSGVLGGPEPSSADRPRFIRGRAAPPTRLERAPPKVDRAYRVVPPWHTNES